jgi:PEP-CTERM/exosortase A-associated glycosyltransferase
MNILHVFYDITQQSGYQIRSKYILSNQKELGLDVTAVFLPLRIETCYKTYVGNVPFLAPEIPQHWQKFLMPKSTYKSVGIAQRALMRRCFGAYLKRLMHEMKPDIVHAHSAWMSAAQAFAAAKTADLPFLYEIRGLWEETGVSEGRTGRLGPRYRYFRLQENRLLRRADAIVALSEGLKEEITNRNIQPEKITVIPNGVDPDEFSPIPRNQELARELGCESNVVVGYISSLRRMEGIKYLLRAMQKTGDDVIAIIVGDGPEKAHLTQLTSDLGVESKVRFIGQAPHERIKQFYSLIDIFVVPRKKEKVCEIVTPLKPLEAMAMGKCVLMSDVGGLRELAVDGETALFFEPESSEALAEKLNVLIADEGFRNAVGANARQYILEKRNWRPLVKDYLPLYEKLMREN